MLIRIKKSSEVASSQIVNKNFYINRRKFLLGATAFGSTTFTPNLWPPAKAGRVKLRNIKKTPWGRELVKTSLEAITSHNNFFEYGSAKSDPKDNSHTLKPRPWTIEISGHVEKPGTYNYEDLVKPHQLEERIYRMRCVEAWSMVIPWVGVPLAKIINQLKI